MWIIQSPISDGQGGSAPKRGERSQLPNSWGSIWFEALRLGRRDDKFLFAQQVAAC
jgi:hypothetical protein